MKYPSPPFPNTVWLVNRHRVPPTTTTTANYCNYCFCTCDLACSYLGRTGLRRQAQHHQTCPWTSRRSNSETFHSFSAWRCSRSLALELQRVSALKMSQARKMRDLGRCQDCMLSRLPAVRTSSFFKLPRRSLQADDLHVFLVLFLEGSRLTLTLVVL